MSPHCGNCGAFVTKQYARVLTPRDVDQPRACPECPDKIRRGGTVDDRRTGPVDE